MHNNNQLTSHFYKNDTQFLCDKNINLISITKLKPTLRIIEAALEHRVFENTYSLRIFSTI